MSYSRIFKPIRYIHFTGVFQCLLSKSSVGNHILWMGKETKTSYSILKQKRERKKETYGNDKWNRMNRMQSLMALISFASTVPRKPLSIRKLSHLQSQQKNHRPPSLLLLPAPAVWKMLHCWTTDKGGRAACLSLPCLACLSTALRLCFVFGTQILQWNSVLENPGCLYNKEHVASLWKNETQWIAIHLFL